MFKYGVFTCPYFATFGLNTERYEVSLRTLSECGKIRTRKNSVFGLCSCSDFQKFKRIVGQVLRKLTVLKAHKNPQIQVIFVKTILKRTVSKRY